MSNYPGHFIQRHGNYVNFNEQSENILPDELVIVDSGDPNTSSGKALYYKPASGNPVRVANAEELGGVNPAVAVDVPPEIADDWDNVKESYAAEKGTLVSVYGDLYFLCQIAEDQGGNLWYDWVLIPDETMIPSISNLVPKTRTIAGLSLQNDISVEALKQALGLS